MLICDAVVRSEEDYAAGRGSSLQELQRIREQAIAEKYRDSERELAARHTTSYQDYRARGLHG